VGYLPADRAAVKGDDFVGADSEAAEGEVGGWYRCPHGVFRRRLAVCPSGENVYFIVEAATEEGLEGLGAAFHEEATNMELGVEGMEGLVERVEGEG
jgi:hypothetical protein